MLAQEYLPDEVVKCSLTFRKLYLLCPFFLPGVCHLPLTCYVPHKVLLIHTKDYMVSAMMFGVLFAPMQEQLF